MAQKINTKRGRPKFQPGEAKSELLRVRVSADEMRSFVAKAGKAGKALPEWVRKSLTDAP